MTSHSATVLSSTFAGEDVELPTVAVDGELGDGATLFSTQSQPSLTTLTTLDRGHLTLASGCSCSPKPAADTFIEGGKGTATQDRELGTHVGSAAIAFIQAKKTKDAELSEGDAASSTTTTTTTAAADAATTTATEATALVHCNTSPTTGITRNFHCESTTSGSPLRAVRLVFDSCDALLDIASVPSAAVMVAGSALMDCAMDLQKNVLPESASCLASIVKGPLTTLVPGALLDDEKHCAYHLPTAAQEAHQVVEDEVVIKAEPLTSNLIEMKSKAHSAFSSPSRSAHLISLEEGVRLSFYDAHSIDPTPSQFASPMIVSVPASSLQHSKNVALGSSSSVDSTAAAPQEGTSHSAAAASSAIPSDGVGACAGGDGVMLCVLNSRETVESDIHGANSGTSVLLLSCESPHHVVSPPSPAPVAPCLQRHEGSSNITSPFLPLQAGMHASATVAAAAAAPGAIHHRLISPSLEGGTSSKDRPQRPPPAPQSDTEEEGEGGGHEYGVTQDVSPALPTSTGNAVTLVLVPSGTRCISENPVSTPSTRAKQSGRLLCPPTPSPARGSQVAEVSSALLLDAPIAESKRGTELMVAAPMEHHPGVSLGTTPSRIDDDMDEDRESLFYSKIEDTPLLPPPRSDSARTTSQSPEQIDAEGEHDGTTAWGDRYEDHCHPLPCRHHRRLYEQGKGDAIMSAAATALEYSHISGSLVLGDHDEDLDEDEDDFCAWMMTELEASVPRKREKVVVARGRLSVAKDAYGNDDGLSMGSPAPQPPLRVPLAGMGESVGMCNIFSDESEDSSSSSSSPFIDNYHCTGAGRDNVSEDYENSPCHAENRARQKGDGESCVPHEQTHTTRKAHGDDQLLDFLQQAQARNESLEVHLHNARAACDEEAEYRECVEEECKELHALVRALRQQLTGATTRSTALEQAAAELRAERDAALAELARVKETVAEHSAVLDRLGLKERPFPEELVGAASRVLLSLESGRLQPQQPRQQEQAFFQNVHQEAYERQLVDDDDDEMQAHKQCAFALKDCDVNLASFRTLSSSIGTSSIVPSSSDAAASGVKSHSRATNKVRTLADGLRKKFSLCKMKVGNGSHTDAVEPTYAGENKEN